MLEGNDLRVTSGDYRVLPRTRQVSLAIIVVLAGSEMSMQTHIGALAFVAATLSLSSAEAQTRLGTVKSLNCVFSAAASGAWKNGQAYAQTQTASLSMRFESINVDEATAQAFGKFGASDIIVKLSLDTLHFLQSFREGALYVTTVFDVENRPGALKAVHTRHEYTIVSLPGFTSTPEQYYGECEPR